MIISIHAPREGGDFLVRFLSVRNCNFNPRPPRGGRLIYHPQKEQEQKISIHAPREGGDARI